MVIRIQNTHSICHFEVNRNTNVIQLFDGLLYLNPEYSRVWELSRPIIDVDAKTCESQPHARRVIRLSFGLECLQKFILKTVVQTASENSLKIQCIPILDCHSGKGLLQIECTLNSRYLLFSSLDVHLHSPSSDTW